MKLFDWDDAKNDRLIAERGISFEEIVLAIEQGKVLDVVPHPDQIKYKGQTLLIIEINEYAYLVPCVESSKTIFLKTIIPSRKATRKYLMGGED